MQHRHFILHKPKGYLSQLVNNQTIRKNKRLLGELYDFPEGTMAIGRLDENSEGLLLLTTDGQVSATIRSAHVEKEYYVELDGEITAEAVNRLQHGLEISIEGTPFMTKPCAAHQLDGTPFERIDSKKRHRPTSWISITLTEGKFRQVRKMTAKVGYPTLRLVRVRIGTIKLEDMPSGTCQEAHTLLDANK